MLPCLSETLTLPCSFADDVAHCADAGCLGMEVWLTKLEQHLEKHSLPDTRRLLSDRNLALAAAAYQGGLLISQGEERKAHYDHFRKRLDICQQLGIPTLIVVADFAGNVDQTTLARAVVSLTQAAQWAEGSGTRLALEFRGKSAFCSSLDTALALINQTGAANVGLNFDVFHYYTGPSKFEDLGLLSVDRLAHVQLSDLAGVPRELAADADRILPGDGDFQIKPLLDHFRSLGYAGWVSVELMNPTLWLADPKQVTEVAFTSLRKILGLTATSAAGAEHTH
ncbi:MAG: sugar phosphate isomerase/epimerase [Planctomycetes bacterium]|nr:sugar phosphate isomerase/epimerase [Planctomycetota bacterium]